MPGAWRFATRGPWWWLSVGRAVGFVQRGQSQGRSGGGRRQRVGGGRRSTVPVRRTGTRDQLLVQRSGARSGPVAQRSRASRIRVDKVGQSDSEEGCVCVSLRVWSVGSDGMAGLSV